MEKNLRFVKLDDIQAEIRQHLAAQPLPQNEHGLRVRTVAPKGRALVESHPWRVKGYNNQLSVLTNPRERN
jgi:hypothetical protein